MRASQLVLWCPLALRFSRRSFGKRNGRAARCRPNRQAGCLTHSRAGFPLMRPVLAGLRVGGTRTTGEGDRGFSAFSASFYFLADLAKLAGCMGQGRAFVG